MTTMSLTFAVVAVVAIAALLAGRRIAVLTRRVRTLDAGQRRSVGEARRHLAAIVEHTDDAVFSLTPSGMIGSWNGGADRLYGYSGREAVGMHIVALLVAEREPEEQAHIARVTAGGAVERYETVHVRGDGGRIDVALTLSPIRDAFGEVVAASVIARDITERKRFEGQLQYLADHDALTGLFNRRRFEEDVERELARSRREGSAGTLLAIDLDHFKEVNDSFGHSAGDELIKRTAEVLHGRLRATDVLARLGGDEFAAMLPGTDAAAARLVAAGLLEALRAERRTGPLPGGGSATASIGIVTFQGTEQITAAELLAEADIAMYAAKAAGRDRAAAARVEEGARLLARTTWPSTT
jgi:diguanylate cyclase (GGDEF)-like protein/PAS domain S-box-containing protein